MQRSEICYNIDGLVQDCSNSTANALELLQSCTKPSIYGLWNVFCTICSGISPKGATQEDSGLGEPAM